MPKYHINKYGEPARCDAKIKCRVNSGDGEHFEGNLSEAVEWAEKKNSQNAGGAFNQETTTAKKKPTTKKAKKSSTSFSDEQTKEFTESVADAINSTPGDIKLLGTTTTNYGSLKSAFTVNGDYYIFEMKDELAADGEYRGEVFNTEGTFSKSFIVSSEDVNEGAADLSDEMTRIAEDLSAPQKETAANTTRDLNAYDSRSRQAIKNRLLEETRDYYSNDENLDLEIGVTAYSAIEETSSGLLDDNERDRIAHKAVTIYDKESMQSDDKVYASKKAIEYAVEETARKINSDRANAVFNQVQIEALNKGYVGTSKPSSATPNVESYKKKVGNSANAEKGTNSITVKEQYLPSGDKPYWKVESTIERNGAGIVNSESKNAKSPEEAKQLVKEYADKQESFVYNGNTGDKVIYKNDIDALTRNDNYEGFGYLGERSRVKSENADTEANGRVDVADEMLINHANKNGLDKDELFEWSNSKAGRWYGDLTIGGRGTEPNAKGNDYAYAQSLLPKKGETPDDTVERSRKEAPKIQRNAR